VTLESPLALNTALSDSRESSNKSGKIKFMRDYYLDQSKELNNPDDIPPAPVNYSAMEFP